jgi:hypothetical protein
MADDTRNHQLRQTLVATQDMLQTALDEVCDDISIATTPTQELIRIEETLALASDAAKQAISLRQRLDSALPRDLV